MGQLETADLLRQRSGERSTLVAEPLALEESRGRGGAVHRHERPARRSPAVNRPCDELLARAGLAEQQHAGIGRGHRGHLAQDAFQRPAFADDPPMLGVANLFFKDVLVARRSFRGNLAERKRILERERSARRSARPGPTLRS